MHPTRPILDPPGIESFRALRPQAIDVVTERLYGVHGSIYERFGQSGRDTCRQDLAFHLDFLQPVIEFGIVEPMAQYLRWQAHVLVSRDIAADHVALSVDWLAEFFAQRMQPAHAAVVVGALHAAKAQCLELGADAGLTQAAAPTRWPECDIFESQLLTGDHRGALATFDASVARSGLLKAEAHVIQPSLYSVGEKWEGNQVSVAQEHLSTSIAKLAMARGLLDTDPPALNGRKILLACVQENEHTVGLQMVADAFQLGGWDVQFLGANVPTESLVTHATTWKPDVVGVSVSFAQQLRSVKDVVSRLHQTCGDERPRVMVGGLAINRFERLAAAVGADASSSNAIAAVAVATQLLTTPWAA